MRRRASSYHHDAMDGGLLMFATGLRNALCRSRKLPPPRSNETPGLGTGRFQVHVTLGGYIGIRHNANLAARVRGDKGK